MKLNAEKPGLSLVPVFPLLRILDTISDEYICALMHLDVAAPVAGANIERSYHCFARAAFPSSVPFKGPGGTERRWGSLGWNNVLFDAESLPPAGTLIIE